MKDTSNGRNGVVYEFDSFRVDELRKCIWHSDELVSITPKAFETLMVLIKNSGEVVAKDAILEEVWPGTFVEESTLSQNILTLRKTLRSFENDKQFIATVPRRGYRFVEPVIKRNGVGESNGSVAVEDSQFNIPKAAQAPARRIVAVLGRRTVLVWALVLAVAAALGVAAYFFFGARQSIAETGFREFRSRTLLADGSIKAAAISPDGSYLSLISRGQGGERLLIRQIDEPDPLEVAAEADGRIIGAAFSPDSRYVYYTVSRQTEAGRLGELVRVPILGGAKQQISRDVDSQVSVSRSGRLAFVRRRLNDGDTQLLVTEGDGSGERVVATRLSDEAFLNASISPDGSRISAAARSKQDLTRPMELIVVDTATGGQSSLTAQTWLWIGQSVWLPDGSGVAVVGYGPMSPDLTDEVWFVSVPDGKARLLESGVNGVFGVSMAADGKSLVAVKSDKITGFAISPLSDLSKEEVIVTKAGDRSLLQLGAEWATDGRIFFATTENGNADLWSIRVDGTERKRLTADKYADLQPRLSPDGKHLYFLSNRSGRMSVWRSNADGSGPQKLTNGSDAFSVTPSPDGRFIYYTLRADSVFSHHLWRASADGTGAVRLTAKSTHLPRVSPDGKVIACLYPASEAGPLVLTILNAENGEVIRQFPERQNDVLFEWQKNGRDLLVLSRNGSGNALWNLSIENGRSTLLREWNNENVFRLAVSPDGARLFVEHGISLNNVILLISEN